MSNNFWKELQKPIISLAPMEDVTDTVFRQIVLENCTSKNLNVLYCEFVSTDGLCHPIGGPKVSHRLIVSKAERKLLNLMNIKIVAQIWGSNPEKFAKAIKIIEEEYDFDGIDINMGCPVRKIINQKACSALIGAPELAKEIIIASKEASSLPISVKTRTGLKEHTTENWIGSLLEVKPTAITLHARTQKMESEKPAEWEQVNIAVNIRNSLDSDTLIFGNGDVISIKDAQYKCLETGADGAMIGRGIFKNPWLFSDVPERERTPEEKLEMLYKHSKLFVETWGKEKNYAILKRFFKIYTFGFYQSADIRGKLMETNNLDEAVEVLSNSIYDINGIAEQLTV